MSTGVNPFRAGRPRVSVLDDSNRRAAGYDAWGVWLNAVRLVQLPDKDFNAEAKKCLRNAAEVLTAKLRRMK